MRGIMGTLRPRRARPWTRGDARPDFYCKKLQGAVSPSLPQADASPLGGLLHWVTMSPRFREAGRSGAVCGPFVRSLVRTVRGSVSGPRSGVFVTVCSRSVFRVETRVLGSGAPQIQPGFPKTPADVSLVATSGTWQPRKNTRSWWSIPRERLDLGTLRVT